MIRNVHWSSLKYPLCLPSFKKINFINGFSKISQISNFMKIRPVGAELFHSDGRTDMTKKTVCSQNKEHINRG